MEGRRGGGAYLRGGLNRGFTVIILVSRSLLSHFIKNYPLKDKVVGDQAIFLNS